MPERHARASERVSDPLGRGPMNLVVEQNGRQTVDITTSWSTGSGLKGDEPWERVIYIDPKDVAILRTLLRVFEEDAPDA